MKYTDRIILASALTLLVSPCFFCSGCGERQNASVDKPDKREKTAEEKKVGSLLDDLKSYQNNESTEIVEPTSHSQALSLARKAIKQEHWSGAIEYASRAVDMKPEAVLGYCLRSEARFKSNRMEDDLVLKDLETAEKLGEMRSQDYEHLSSIYSTTGNTGKALNAINRAIKLEPDDRYLYQNRAALYSNLNRKEKALADLDTMIALHPKDPNGYAIKAKYLESYGDKKEALQTYADAVKLAEIKRDFGTIEILKSRARLLVKINELERAIKDLDRAIEICDGDDDDLFSMRGHINADLGRDQEALADFTRVIDRSPEYAMDCYRARSTIYKKLGKEDLALADRKKADGLDRKKAEKPVFEMPTSKKRTEK